MNCTAVFESSNQGWLKENETQVSAAAGTALVLLGTTPLANLGSVLSNSCGAGCWGSKTIKTSDSRGVQPRGKVTAGTRTNVCRPSVDHRESLYSRCTSSTKSLMFSVFMA